MAGVQRFKLKDGVAGLLAEVTPEKLDRTLAEGPGDVDDRGVWFALSIGAGAAIIWGVKEGRKGVGANLLTPH